MRSPLASIALAASSLLAACGGTAPSGVAPSSRPRAAAAAPSPVATTPEQGEPAVEAPLPPGTYRIKLTRSVRPGDRRHETTVATDSLDARVVLGKRVLKDDQRRVRVSFVATSRVLSVDARGKPTANEYSVEKFVADGARGDEPIVPAGTVMKVVKGAKDGAEPHVESTSGALSRDALKALGLVVSTKAGATTDDDVFGTREPRRPGSSWPVAGERAAIDLSGTGFHMTASDVEGQTRFIDVKDERGTECLQIAGRLTAKASGFDGLPPGSTFERAVLGVDFAGSFPVDLGKPVVRQTTRVTIDLRAQIPTEDGPAVFTMTGLQTRDSTYEAAAP